MNDRIAQLIIQVRELVRSATNHGRRIRRLESLQTPVTIARPQGGHIIQDEGIPLTDRVYLNFVGVRVVASDDPDNGATIITVSDPEGDDFCRVVPLDVGFQISAGTDYRFLKHSTAFQLTDAGDTRGVSAIDLQIDQFNPTYVAGAPLSAILTGEENKIESDCDSSAIAGPWNEITGGSVRNYILGWADQIYAGSLGNTVLGGAHTVDDAKYNSVFGYSNDLDGAYGCFVAGEEHDLIQNADDGPASSTCFGILNDMEGDVVVCHQFGEDLRMYALGSTSAERISWSGQFGYRHYAQNVESNWQFGRDTKSFLSNADAAGEYYNGRIVHNGDAANDNPTDGTGEVGGFNQDSWFSQNDVISTWNVAWTTGRFEFPIIQDSIWTFTILISMTEKGCVNSHSFKIEGVIENDGGVTTMLVSTVTNIYRDVATKEVQAVADNANDRLAIQYRDTGGPDATWTNVQFSMMTAEVGAEV